MQIRFLCGLLALATLIAACGGGGSSTPATPTTSTPSTSPSASPATFGGGTQTVSMMSSGGTFTISPADATYSGTVTWGANSATNPFNFTVSWATYAQISGASLPSALPSSIGTALLYLAFNPSSAVTFTQTPALTVSTSGSFPGTSCGFATYTNNGGTGYAWSSMTTLGIAEVTPSGGSFSVPATTLPPPNTVDFAAATDQYVVTYCH